MTEFWALVAALVAAVIGSAELPTLIANAFFLPRHLLPRESGAARQAEDPQTTVRRTS